MSPSTHIPQDIGPIEVERADLEIPHLPVGLEGLSILHISDTHVTLGRGAGRQLHDRLLERLGQPDEAIAGVELVVLTGDYMSRDGDEAVATDALGDLVRASAALSARGCFGVFGNHDHLELKVAARQRSSREGWPVQWLSGRRLEMDGLALELIGSDWPEAYPPSEAGRPEGLERGGPLRLALAHTPDATREAHHAGAHLVLAGHTHGGQIRMRLPGGGVLAGFTSSDLIPRRAPSGVYRYLGPNSPEHAPTTLAVTRGVGFQQLPVRVCCPPQIVRYTLRGREPGGGRGASSLPPEPVGPEGRLEVLRVW
jgi:predicted MPP superfamily phosphohydrolase